MAKRGGTIRIGIGGWTFEPWRARFYPAGLPQRRELEYAAGKLTTIEVNGTYYGSQKPESFAKWHDETPEDFVFSLKAPRFATNRRVLAEAGQSIERFFASGVLELKDKLGPINWQFLPTKKFDPEDFARFLALLPKSVEGRAIRHVVEVRHESFRHPDFVAMAREHGVAVVIAGDSEHPVIPDLTAPFVYARIMGTAEHEPRGYPDSALDLWAGRLRSWRQRRSRRRARPGGAGKAGRQAARRVPLRHQRPQAAQPRGGHGADRKACLANPAEPPPPRGGHRVLQQAGDRHRPDAARHRRDRTGHRGAFGEGDIAHQAPVRQPVDAHIDDRRTGCDPIPPHHLRPADRRDDQFRAPALGGEVAAARMRDRDRRIRPREQRRDRASDQRGAPEHQRPSACERAALGLEQLHHPERGARDEGGQPFRKPADIERRQPVHVLRRIERVEHGAGADLRRQRKLHQDAVNLRVCGECGELAQQRRFARIRGQPDRAGRDARRLRRAVLRAHIDRARRVVADQHDDEARPESELRHLPRHALPQRAPRYPARR